MRIEVRLFATLAAFLPPDSRDGSAVLDVPAESTVADVGRRLGIPVDLSMVSLVNGMDVDAMRRLAAHDVIELFPPLAGG